MFDENSIYKPVIKKEKVISLEEEVKPYEFGDDKKFMAELVERSKTATREDVAYLINTLNRLASTSNREVIVIPDKHKNASFSCSEHAAKTINNKGEIVEDPDKKLYIIGVPAIFLLGQAPINFLKGEIQHEKGHAIYTDFSMMEKLATLAKSEGYPPSTTTTLLNCIEDPRMERYVGGPINEGSRKQLFEKNNTFIMPNIMEVVRKDYKGSLAQQLNLLIKLEMLWNLHKLDIGEDNVAKPWDINNVNPLVLEIYKKIYPDLVRIIGAIEKRGMSVSQDIYETIKKQIWPEYKKVLDYDKEHKPEKGEGEEGEGEGEEGEGEGEEGEGEEQDGEEQEGQEGKEGNKRPKEGKPSNKPPKPGQYHNNNLDPLNLNKWPKPEAQLHIEAKKKYDNEKEAEARRKKEESKNSEQNKDKLDQELHNLLKKKDGFENPEDREAYYKMVKEIAPAIHAIRQIFNTYIPKNIDSENEWGRKGKTFNVKRYVQKIKSGEEKPLGRKNVPEEKAFILQIIIDKSGSMSEGGASATGGNNRIQEAIKATAAIVEAAEGFPIELEILVSDDFNVSNRPEYCIKSFNQRMDGKLKADLMRKPQEDMKNNKDDESILVALPRIKKVLSAKSAEVDRVKALTIFITDSTTLDDATKAAVDFFRSQHIGLEGTIIEPDPKTVGCVKKHFGEDSIIPSSFEEFPTALKNIIKRYVKGLK